MITCRLLCLVVTVGDVIPDVCMANFSQGHFKLRLQQTSAMMLGIATIARNSIRLPLSTATLLTRSQQARQERAANKFGMRPQATESTKVFE